MSEQKKNPVVEESPITETKQIKHRDLLYLVIIVVFLIATCVCIFFLGHVIKNEADNIIVGLWTVAVSLSLLVVIVPTVLLLTRRYKEKWKADIKTESIEYVENIRASIKKANAASVCPEEPNASQSEFFVDTYPVLQKQLELLGHTEISVKKKGGITLNKGKRAARLDESLKPKKVAVTPKPVRNNSAVDALQEAMLNNLGEMQKDCDWSERITETVFQVAIAVCIFGLLILTASILLPVILKQSFETTYPVAIGGVISQFITGTLFVIYNKSLKQQNIYRQDLRAYESILSTTSLINLISSSKERDRILKEVIRKTLKNESNPTPASTDPSNEDGKDNGNE